MSVVRLLRRRRATPSGNCSKWCLIRIRTIEGRARPRRAPRGTSEPCFRAGPMRGTTFRGEARPKQAISALAVDVRSFVQSPEARGPVPEDNKTLSAMALLTLITLSAVIKAGPDRQTVLGQRATKVQLVQLCQTAHANKDQILPSDEFTSLLSQLSDTPRRRHPAVPERWACSLVSACEKVFSRPGVALGRNTKFKKTQVARRPRPRRGARRRGLRRRLAGRAGRGVVGARTASSPAAPRRRRRGSDISEDGAAGLARGRVHAPLAAPARRAAAAAAGTDPLPRQRLCGPARRLHGLRRRRVADGSDEHAAAHARVIDYYDPAPPVL